MEHPSGSLVHEIVDVGRAALTLGEAMAERLGVASRI